MRGSFTRSTARELMRELARSAPRGRRFRVYFLGGGTAVLSGWRESTIDADLHADDQAVFRDVQGLKERLGINIEFVRPEDFVPALAGSEERHLFLETVDRVSFHHYDPYAQLLSKLVRGFEQDLQDAKKLVESGMVDVRRFRSLVRDVPEASYARYPELSRAAVLDAVEGFLATLSVEDDSAR